MRSTPVRPDPRPVPTIAEQLRAERHRRERRRRTAVGTLVLLPVVLLGARLLPDAGGGTAGAKPGTTTSTSGPANGLDPGLVGAFGRAQATAAAAGHHLTI